MITVEFLQQVAGFVDRRIDRVVLNGSYEITEFDLKRVDENAVHLAYTVPDRSLEVINLIEIMNSEGQVISSNTVYVPVASDTLIQQTIRVEEG